MKTPEVCSRRHSRSPCAPNILALYLGCPLDKSQIHPILKSVVNLLDIPQKRPESILAPHIPGNRRDQEFWAAWTLQKSPAATPSGSSLVLSASSFWSACVLSDRTEGKAIKKKKPEHPRRSPRYCTRWRLISLCSPNLYSLDTRYKSVRYTVEETGSILGSHRPCKRCGQEFQATWTSRKPLALMPQIKSTSRLFLSVALRALRHKERQATKKEPEAPVKTPEAL